MSSALSSHLIITRLWDTMRLFSNSSLLHIWHHSTIYIYCSLKKWDMFFRKIRMMYVMTRKCFAFNIAGSFWWNQSVLGGFPSQRESIVGFDVSFVVYLNKLLNKQLSCRCTEASWRSDDVTVTCNYWQQYSLMLSQDRLRWCLGPCWR